MDSLNSDFKDKEDGLQYFTAVDNDMDFLITRDKKKTLILPLEKSQSLLQTNFFCELINSAISSNPPDPDTTVPQKFP